MLGMPLWCTHPPPTTVAECQTEFWAINLADDSKPITHFDTGANPVGDLAFSEKGTVFVAVGKAPASAAYSNAVVALEPRTLTPQTWFSDPAADFASTPTVIKDGTRRSSRKSAKMGESFYWTQRRLAAPIIRPHSTFLLPIPRARQTSRM